MKAPTIMLSLCLATTQVKAAEAHQSPGGCAAAVVAVVVVVGIGVAGYIVVKKCQKKFKKWENRFDDSQETNSLAYGHTYSATLEWDELGSCYVEDPCYPDDKVTLTKLESVVGPNMALTVGASPNPSQITDCEEFERALAHMGLVFTGHQGNEAYSQNGHPIPADMSPIIWDAERRLVKVVGQSLPTYTVTIERSETLEGWAPLLTTEVEEGNRLELWEVSDANQAFYRVRSELTD